MVNSISISISFYDFILIALLFDVLAPPTTWVGFYVC
jgi:hypothetical protein